MLGSRIISRELADLGNRVRERRREIHLSQEALAEKAGISPNTVSRIEGGQMAMSVGIFQRIVKVLGMDANLLLGHTAAEAGEGREMQEMLWRASHLRKGEREVVARTMETLMDGLEKNRRA